MHLGSADGPLERVYSEENPFGHRRQICPEDDSSLRNMQHLDQEEDEGLIVDSITIPDAKISTSDIKKVKTSSLNHHRHWQRNLMRDPLKKEEFSPNFISTEQPNQNLQKNW